MNISENDLRFIVSKLLVEETGGDIGQYQAGEFLDAREKAAKEAYESAQANLAAWDDNEKKRLALIAAIEEKAASSKISTKTASDKYKKILTTQPELAYDPKLGQKKRKTFEDELSKAEDLYANYNPQIRGYKADKKGGAKTTAAAVLPDKKTKAFLQINDVKPLEWYTWPDKIIKKAGISYGSKNAKISMEDAGPEAASGTGPGEEWLGYIFGGKVQGGGVSFDVVTPDGRCWEVKQLLSSSETIRPGTEGLKAYTGPRKRLENIMRQLKNFSTTARRPTYDSVFTEEDKKKVNFVSVFVEDDYEMIVDKGEFSDDRRVRLRGVLKMISEFKKNYAASRDGDVVSVDTRVSLNDKEVKVDKPTFIDIAKKVEKATGNKEVLKDFEVIELLLTTLKDPAFDNPTEFFNEWYNAIDLSKVFSQVDGIFIVNPRGYMMIPTSMLKKALKFNKVTQGRPRFSLMVSFGP